jgi:hypothetical protein
LATPGSTVICGGSSTVTNPLTDDAADISFKFEESFQCITFTGGPLCPGTPASASLRIDAVPEPSSLLLLGSGLTVLAVARRKRRG